MPLSILLPMVGAGIAAIAVLLHLLGLSRKAELADEAAARAAWLREFPADTVLCVTLCRDRGAALIGTAQGPGVVWAVGADTAARRLEGARAHRTAEGLSLDLVDFTAPRVRLRLDAEETRRGLELLEGRA